MSKTDKLTASATILVVEDEESIRELLIFSLETAGHSVLAAGSVHAANKMLESNSIDVALIDWMLPGGSGLEFVRKLRNSEPYRELPIIMLTARTEEADITAGLDAGADDYVTKPFSPRELKSRIGALLRRAKLVEHNNEVVTVGPLQLNTATHRIVCHGQAIESGHTEYKLLRFFMQNPDKVFSRNQLLDHVWGTNTFIEERTIDVHILRLRKLLKPVAADKMLETVRGAGYRLNRQSSE